MRGSIKVLFATTFLTTPVFASALETEPVITELPGTDVAVESVFADDSRDAAPAHWDVSKLARKSEIVAVGRIEAIGLDPTSRHPRIVGLFRVEEAIAGVRVGESFTVLWSAPLPRNAMVPQAGERIVLFGNNGMDGLVRPAGNGSGIYKVVPGRDGTAASAYRDFRSGPQVASNTTRGGEEFLPLDGFVEALRDAR